MMKSLLWYNLQVRKVVFYLIFLLIIGVVAISASFWIPKLVRDDKSEILKAPLLKVGLVADSHNNNDLLAKALAQARGLGVDFVIGLGDYTKVGTIEELAAAKKVFEESGLEYYVTAGDHDLWAGREERLKGTRGTEGTEDIEGTEGGKTALDNFRAVFGEPTSIFDRKKVQFVILDNSDIYTGISQKDWEALTGLNSSGTPADARALAGRQGLTLSFVFAHKSPYHPQSAHIMGETTPAVAKQANQLIKLIERVKIDGFFSGDLHFFAQFSSKGGSASGGLPGGSVKMTTIGAVTRTPNPQGPRFAVLTVYKDYSWEVEDVEIK